MKEDIERKMLAHKEELIARILESSSFESQSLASSMDEITKDAVSTLQIEKRKALATRDRAAGQVKEKEKALKRLEKDIKRKAANEHQRQKAAERRTRRLRQQKAKDAYNELKYKRQRVIRPLLVLLGTPLYLLAYFSVVQGWEHLFWEGIASTLIYIVGTTGIAAGLAIYLLFSIIFDYGDRDAEYSMLFVGCVIFALGFLFMGLGFALIWYDNSQEWAYWKSIWYYMTNW